MVIIKHKLFQTECELSILVSFTNKILLCRVFWIHSLSDTSQSRATCTGLAFFTIFAAVLSAMIYNCNLKHIKKIPSSTTSNFYANLPYKRLSGQPDQHPPYLLCLRLNGLWLLKVSERLTIPLSGLTPHLLLEGALIVDGWQDIHLPIILPAYVNKCTIPCYLHLFSSTQPYFSSLCWDFSAI